MIRLNLLPHREQKRQKARHDFYIKSALSALTGAIIVVIASILVDMRIAHQRDVNRIIASENSKLDGQMHAVATLTQEISALTARQKAVENLQSDRNQSVYLMEALAHQVPDGMYLYEIIQEEKNITLHGYAQTNEHVSEFMRNIDTHAQWISAPQLQEIKSIPKPRLSNAAPLFDFTMTVALTTARTLSASNTDNQSDIDDNDVDDSDNIDAVDPPPELKEDMSDSGNRKKRDSTS
jgi:type IV pilus assembly protein PilN